MIWEIGGTVSERLPPYNTITTGQDCRVVPVTRGGAVHKVVLDLTIPETTSSCHLAGDVPRRPRVEPVGSYFKSSRKDERRSVICLSLRSVRATYGEQFSARTPQKNSEF